MNFEWTKEQLEVRDKLDALLKQEAKEDFAKLEKADLVENKAVATKYIKAFADTGYSQLATTPANANQMLTLTAAQERLAESCSSFFVATEASLRLFGGLLSSTGNTDLLSQIQKGEMIGAIALSGAKDFSASQDGDGYKVSGTWDFVTNGPIADSIAVVGKQDDQPIAFLVRPGDSGVTIGPRLETLGYKGLAVSSVELNGAVVSKENVIGPMTDSSIETWLFAMQDMILTHASIGIVRRVLATATNYAKTHQPSGKPIIRYQEIGFKLAEMYALLQTMEWYARRAAWMINEGDAESATLIECAKIFASETCEKIASWGMQVMAGAGFVSGNEVEQGYRDAKFAPLAGTSNEIARMKIANDLLTRYQV